MAGPDLSALGVPLKSDDDDTSALLPMIDHLENSDAAALRMGIPVDQVVSPAGAIGRYQVMPSTGAALGYTEDQLKTPEGNAAAARDVLKQLAQRYGKDPATIAAAYNGGPSRADQIKAGGLDQVPKETADYYSRALKYMAQGAGAVGDAVAPPAQADTGPDLSKFGEPVQDGPAGPDLSGFGEPLKGAAKPGPTGSATDYVKGMFSGAGTLAREAGQGVIEFGGSLVHGLGEMGRGIGTGLQGVVTGIPDMLASKTAIMDAIDNGKPVDGLLAPPAPGVGQGSDAAFAAKYQASDPVTRAAMRQKSTSDAAYWADPKNQQASNVFKLGSGVERGAQPVAQAGTDITASAPKLIPTTKEQDESLTGKIGKTGGFVAPMILTDVFTGPLGVMAEAGSQGYGDTYDQAKKAGADERTAQQAGLFGGLTQAGLMAVPVHQAVGLVGKLAKPMQNKFLIVVGEMAKSGITFSAFSQLSRLADNVVAKNTYDPDRDLLDGLGDLKDMAAQGIAGTVMPLAGLAGAGAARFAGRGKGAAAPPGDNGGPPPGANEPAPMATPPGPDGGAPPAPPAPPGAAAPGLTPIHDPVTWAQTGWRDAAGKVVPLDAAQVPADHDLNAGGAPAPQLVQTVDQAFKAKMAAKFPDEARWAAPEPVKTSILLADAIATGKYNDALHPSNPNSRATFEAMTGQTLPRSVAATKALFQGKPFQVVKSAENSDLVAQGTAQLGFTTNPAKIASEHEAEVSRLAAEGAAAAAANNPPPGPEASAPPVEAKKVGKVRGLPVPPQSGPVDLASFLASRGGIRDDEGHDLVKGRGLQQFIPGHGPLIRPGGMSVDDAGEVAHEFGYFGPPGSTDRPTEDDVLQLLEKTGRGADGQRTKVYTPEEEGQGAQAQRENARTDEQNDAAMDEVRAAAKSAGETMTDDEIHQIAVDMVTHGIDPESAVAEHIERKAIRGVYSDDDEQGPSQTAAQPDQGKSGEADRGSQSGVPESEAGGGEAGGARPAGPAAPENSGQAPPAVERGADGLPQTILPGAEASAQQAAKARGEKIKPKAAQQDAGGMFEPPKAKEPGLFEQGAKGVEVPDGHEIEPASPVPSREQSQKGGKFTAVARRTKPFSAERGYGDTPEAAQRDALRRLAKGAPQMPVEATGDRTLFRKTIGEGGLATVNGTHYGVQEAMPGHWVVRETRDGYTVRTGEPRPDGTGLSRAQAIQKVFEKAFPDARGEEEAGGHPEISADQARAALESNIDPRTGKRPIGNKALRDFRADMQDVVDRSVSVKQDVARETGLQKDERSRVQPVSEPSGTEAPPLSEMSRRKHERMAENPSPHRGAEGQAEGEGVREGVSPEGETRAPAVPVRGEGGNAPRGLLEAAGRDVAVPEVPPRGAQDKALADQVKKHLETGEKPMDQKGLSRLADEAYGGTAGEGVHDPRRAYDAMELGVNRYVAAHPDLFDPRADAGEAKKAVERLRALEAKLPIQSRRTGATDAFQQFSTPPAYAYAAVWAGHPDAADVVLEPSAGNGGLATFAKNADAKVVANEISEGRRKNLESLDFAAVTGHDAEQINNLLPKGTTPSLVLMNPPFSNAAQRGGVKDSNITGRHMDQALKALAPGGRLVAITGNNFVEGNTHNRAFFQKWGKEARIRASVEVSGKVFHRYGTSYPTRVIIIDKLPPDGRPAITGSVETPEELIDRLESVRNDRPESQGTIAAADRGGLPAAEQASAEQGGEGASGDERGSRDAVLPPVGGAGPSRSGSQSEPDAAANAGGSPRNAQGGAGAEGNELAGAGGRGRAGVAGRSEGSGDRSGATPGEQVGGDDAGLSANDKPSDVLNYRGGQQATPGEELAGGVYSLYKPQRLVIAGAKPHPAELVQSAAMATVAPPEPTYKPSLDQKVISDGKLSEAQLEPVVYAGQAHSKLLPDGVTRRGFFVGDGTGVGKGREISGVIMDNWNQGRKKAVWISEKWPLFDDAKRDWSGIGGDVKHLINGKKFKQVDQIDAPHGILFSTYDTLKGKPKKGTTGQTRVEQIVKWLGKDFDGVVAFDEAHNMANADAQKGSRGKTLPAEKALAGLEMQKQLPNARVLYVSATGATEVKNLGYAERLGLWGPGTSFGTKAQFMAQIEQGGVAAMELVARDLKQMGSYLARGLSFNGVEYGRLEHKLSDGQRSMYDALADSWQMVLQNIDKALEITGAKDDARSKSAAYSAFWGSHQRFFNQILTSMQMPTVLEQAERDMKEGRSPVFQLVNTNEAASERALARMDQDEGSLEDLDLTPRDQLMQMVEHSFPVTAMESYLDENGTKRSRAVMDSQGNAVQDREAVALRDKVLDDLASIKVPDGPLEYLLNKFGPDTIAEVTGRGRRVVERNGKRVVENRPGSANTAEADAFMSGRKKALVFSQAGGTGRSYHADAGAKNQARRVHYLLQPGWSAAPAIQGFGRTHRSNQTSKPLYRLATTDVVGQKRFISSIARRLDQLGALTKGERRSGGQGFFSEKDNLESQYAADAVTRLVTDIIQRKKPMQDAGLTPDVLTQQMGFRSLINPDSGGLNVGKMPDVPQFLNRLLSLRLDMQNKVFDAFDRYFEDNIASAKAAGTLDAGVEQLQADHIKSVNEQTVHTDADSGAETKYVSLETKTKNKPRQWDSVKSYLKTEGAFVGEGENGRAYMFLPTRDKTDDRGTVVPQMRRIGPVTETIVPAWAASQKFDKLEGDAAQKAWEKEMARIPEFQTKTQHMITGALLPIWDRLPKGFARVMRAKTDDGKSYLGRVIPEEHLQATLKNLGATGSKIEMAPDQIMQKVKDGDVLTLANGWKLQRRVVAGETRVRLVGPDVWSDRRALENRGVQFERAGYEGMLFVPDNERGRAFLEQQVRHSPIVSSTGEDEGPMYAHGGDEESAPFYSALTRAIEGVKQDKAPAQQWVGLIDNMPGVRADEVEWSGVKDFLAEQKGPVSKDDLLDHVRSNEVHIEEVVKGGDKANPALEEIQREREAMTNELREWAEKHDHPFMSADELQAEISSRRREVVGDPDAEKNLRDQSRWLSDYVERWEMLDDREHLASKNRGENDTKWSGYTLPGGKNYRELLLTLPKNEVAAKARHEAAKARMAATRTDDPSYEDRMREVSRTGAEMMNPRGAGEFKSGHWDEPNILAHVRFDSREEKTPGFVVKNSESGNTSDAFDTREEAEAYQNRLPEAVRGQTEIKAVKAGKTKRVLHIAEVQSDWHQSGRKRGYKGTEDDVRRAREARDTLWPQAREALSKNDMAGFDTATEALTAFGGHPDWRDRWEINAEDQPIIQKYIDAQKALYQAKKGVTDAPFKKNWHELAMKRMLRHAAEHGYDRLSWDTGDTQVARYNLERHVRSLSYKKRDDGHFDLWGQVGRGDGRAEHIGTYKETDLAGVVGEDMAAQIRAGQGRQTGFHGSDKGMMTLDSADLRVGGEGQRGFYDKILPQFVNKYVKKWGAKVERTEVKTGDPNNRTGWESTGNRFDSKPAEVHSVKITPEMRESVMKGQPMFAHDKGGAGPEGFSPGTRIKDVGGSRKAQMIFRPEFDQMREKVEPALRYWLNKYGLSDLVRLEVPDLMRDAAGNSPRGLYFRDLIAIALSKDPHSYKGKMGHEVIHAVKGLGLIDGPEWKVLADKARAEGWQAKYVDSEPKYASLSPEKKIEEAIAHAFPDWEAGKLKSLGNVAHRFFRRLKNVIEAVRNAFKGNGFDSAESVFKKVSSGEIGRRGARPVESDGPDFAHSERDDGEPEKEPDDHTPFWGRVDRSIGKASAATGKRLRTAANKVFPDSIKSAADAVQMAVAPMASGSEEARASAKDFANAMREARVFTGKKMEYLVKNFTPDQLKTMWEAADEQSVAMQEGRSVEGIGLSKLAPDERKAVEAFQMESNAILRIAQDIGLFKGEGLPSYVPRMVVAMGADGRYDRIKGGGGDVAHGLDAIGRNLKTTSPNLKHRKYLTTEETEEAANALAPGAMVVKDFRTLPLAMGRLKEAIAGRTLIDNIRAMGQSAGEATVVEGEIPDATAKGGWFTLDHPAFKTYRPKFVRNADTGRVEVMTDQNGDELFERVPVYVRKDFEGPLRAVLSRDTSQIYKAAMSLKGKTMSVIMYSPLMHNAVIWGKAFPTAPIKLMKPLWRDDDGKYHVSIELYGRGRAVKNDPVALRQAVLDGVDPVGHRYFNQDASALMEEPNIKPGRSWTSKIVAYVPGLFDPKAGDAVKRSIDKLGDIWHNKLLWDLVGDLQLGLYQHLKGAAMKAGHDEQSAGRYAAHFANRYAGALPIESMSKIARQTANMLMFSRSFTLTNLGAYKDLTVGLPKDVQAQIARDKGLDALTNIQGAAHRKAASLLAMDIFLSHVGLFMAQYATAYALHHAFYPPSQNEPDRENRFLIGYQKDGTAIYGRLPTGKVGEELQDWVTEPVDLTKRKLSPFAQVAYGLFSNDQGFGRKIYDPYDKSAMGYVKNLGRVVKYASESVAPIAPFEALFDLNRGHGDPNTNWLKIVAPMVGVTVSKGAPGGPAIGALFASKDEQEFQIGEQMPEIRDEIANGDLKTAVAKMVKLGMSPSYRQFTIRVTKNPGARLTSKQIGQFMRTASPDERAKMENYLRVPKPGQEAGPQAPDLPDDQHSALEPTDLGGALKANRLKQFAAAGNTWSRNDAIRAAQAAGLTNTAALLREAGPLSPRLREKVLAETGSG